MIYHQSRNGCTGNRTHPGRRQGLDRSRSIKGHHDRLSLPAGRLPKRLPCRGRVSNTWSVFSRNFLRFSVVTAIAQPAEPLVSTTPTRPSFFTWAGAAVDVFGYRCSHSEHRPSCFSRVSDIPDGRSLADWLECPWAVFSHRGPCLLSVGFGVDVRLAVSRPRASSCSMMM